MKVLVIGGGGREHALAWKLAQSPKLQAVYVAPGNGGTVLDPRLENVPITDVVALREWAQKEKIVLTVVGPEAPLAAGVVDEFRWFCEARRSLEEGAPTPSAAIDAQRYAAARRAFGAPRFFAVYRAWRARGEPALNELLSPRLHDAWTRGDARVDIHVLPHQYHHLAPAVATA